MLGNQVAFFSSLAGNRSFPLSASAPPTNSGPLSHSPRSRTQSITITCRLICSVPESQVTSPLRPLGIARPQIFFFLRCPTLAVGLQPFALIFSGTLVRQEVFVKPCHSYLTWHCVACWLSNLIQSFFPPRNPRSLGFFFWQRWQPQLQFCRD